MKSKFDFEGKELKVKFVLTSTYNKAIVDTVKDNLEDFQKILLMNINNDN